MEPATRNMPITIVEEECYEDLNVSTATTTTSRTSGGYSIAYNYKNMGFGT
jgi:hypothetical protein